MSEGTSLTSSYGLECACSQVNDDGVDDSGNYVPVSGAAGASVLDDVRHRSHSHLRHDSTESNVAQVSAHPNMLASHNSESQEEMLTKQSETLRRSWAEALRNDKDELVECDETSCSQAGDGVHGELSSSFSHRQVQHPIQRSLVAEENEAIDLGGSIQQSLSRNVAREDKDCIQETCGANKGNNKNNPSHKSGVDDDSHETAAKANVMPSHIALNEEPDDGMASNAIPTSEKRSQEHEMFQVAVMDEGYKTCLKIALLDNQDGGMHQREEPEAACGNNRRDREHKEEIGQESEANKMFASAPMKCDGMPPCGSDSQHARQCLPETDVQVGAGELVGSYDVCSLLVDEEAYAKVGGPRQDEKEGAVSKQDSYRSEERDEASDSARPSDAGGDDDNAAHGSISGQDQAAGHRVDVPPVDNAKKRARRNRRLKVERRAEEEAASISRVIETNVCGSDVQVDDVCNHVLAPTQDLDYAARSHQPSCAQVAGEEDVVGGDMGRGVAASVAGSDCGIAQACSSAAAAAACPPHVQWDSCDEYDQCNLDVHAPAGAHDADAHDAGARDAGTRDADARDAGARDAGARDAGCVVHEGISEEALASDGLASPLEARPDDVPTHHVLDECVAHMHDGQDEAHAGMVDVDVMQGRPGAGDEAEAQQDPERIGADVPLGISQGHGQKDGDGQVNNKYEGVHDVDDESARIGVAEKREARLSWEACMDCDGHSRSSCAVCCSPTSPGMVGDAEVVDLQGEWEEHEGGHASDQVAGSDGKVRAEAEEDKWEDIPIKLVDLVGGATRTRSGGDSVDGSGRSLGRQRRMSLVRSFMLLDGDGDVCVGSEQELCRLLSSHSDLSCKVVSVLGAPCSGKSHALNETMFAGDAVFQASDAAQASACTQGAWAALDPVGKVIVVDMQGMIEVPPKSSGKHALLLKVLAISDVVVFITTSERIHNDMLALAEDASASFCDALKHEMNAAAAAANLGMSSVGPALIVFHTTRGAQASVHQDGIAERFSVAGGHGFAMAYSSMEYVWGKRASASEGGDFGQLQAAVRKALDDSSVRLRRPPGVLLSQLIAVGDVITRVSSADDKKREEREAIRAALPDVIFRCPVRCLSCNMHCQGTAGHAGDHVASQQLCTYSTKYDNVEQVCQACVRMGVRSVVKKEESKTFGVVWSVSWTCGTCKGVHRSNALLGSDKETREKLRADYFHVWQEADQQLANKPGSNAGRMCMEHVMRMASSMASAGEQPVSRALGAVKEWTRPDYWVPDESIVECTACRKVFGVGDAKHHCRNCGEGFCGACSEGRKCVPNRGWCQPVRVCARCLQWLESCEDVASTLEKVDMASSEGEAVGSASDREGAASDMDEDWGIIASGASALPSDAQCQDVWSAVYVPVTGVQAPNIPRKGVEHIVGAVQALQCKVTGYSRAVAGMVAPDYWEKDADIRACAVCSISLCASTELAATPERKGGSSSLAPRKAEPVHHCRACGKGVCGACSRSRRKVPARGWEEAVRVCDSCASQLALDEETTRRM